jgi:hypothetical protein
MLIVLLAALAAWFVMGYLYAPRSAANCYKTFQHSPSNWRVVTDHDRKKSAKAGYAASLWFGPIVLTYWLLRLRVFKPLKKSRADRLHKALVTHVPEVRQAEYDKLVAENDRLTREILGEPEPVKPLDQKIAQARGRRMARMPRYYIGARD